jgi:hypothetical protein
VYQNERAIEFYDKISNLKAGGDPVYSPRARHNRGVYFDGEDYQKIGGLSFHYEFSLAMWFKLDTTEASVRTLFTAYASDPRDGDIFIFNLRFDSANYLVMTFTFADDKGAAESLTDRYNFLDGNWTKISLSMEKQQTRYIMKHYKNGVIADITPHDTEVPTTNLYFE